MSMSIVKPGAREGAAGAARAVAGRDVKPMAARKPRALMRRRSAPSAPGWQPAARRRRPAPGGSLGAAPAGVASSASSTTDSLTARSSGAGRGRCGGWDDGLPGAAPILGRLGVGGYYKKTIIQLSNNCLNNKK